MPLFSLAPPLDNASWKLPEAEGGGGENIALVRARVESLSLSSSRLPRSYFFLQQ
jgi:hypothetical protein